MKIDDLGYLWILFSNNTIIIYEIDKSSSKDKGFSGLLEFERINVNMIVNKNRKKWRDDDLKVINFHLLHNFVLLFTGDNSTYVFEYEAISRDLQSEKLLPVYLLPSDDSKRVRLSYTVSSKTNKVNYSTFNQYLVVLFEKLKDEQHYEYVLYFYDIKEGRHNSLIMRVSLNLTDIKELMDLGYT